MDGLVPMMGAVPEPAETDGERKKRREPGITCINHTAVHHPSSIQHPASTTHHPSPTFVPCALGGKRCLGVSPLVLGSARWRELSLERREGTQSHMMGENDR